MGWFPVVFPDGRRQKLDRPVAHRYISRGLGKIPDDDEASKKAYAEYVAMLGQNGIAEPPHGALGLLEKAKRKILPKKTTKKKNRSSKK